MNTCGNCANMNRGDPELATPGIGYCYAKVSAEDLAKVAAILPAACMLHGVTWREAVKDSDGDRWVVGQFEKQLNRNDGAVEALKLI